MWWGREGVGLLPDTNQEAMGKCDVMHAQGLTHTHTHGYWLFWIHLIKAVKLLFLCFPDYPHTNLYIDRNEEPSFLWHYIWPAGINMHYLSQLQGQEFPINSTITSIDKEKKRKKWGEKRAPRCQGTQCGLLLEIAQLQAHATIHLRPFIRLMMCMANLITLCARECL